VNDAPDAVGDTNWVLDVTTGANPTTSGNVLTTTPHTGAPSGTFSDSADTDVDNGTTLTVTGISGGTVGSTVNGLHGTLVINADGTYTYTLNASDTTVNALGAGQTTFDLFTYTISDGNGGTDTATLTVTIFGVNDAPDANDDSNWVLDVTTGANPTAGGTSSRPAALWRAFGKLLGSSGYRSRPWNNLVGGHNHGSGGPGSVGGNTNGTYGTWPSPRTAPTPIR
jgi:VCBS repeat-containing protein